MFVPVQIGVNGQAMYATGFDLLEREARDMSIPLGEIGGRLLEDIGAQFGSEGGWSGNPWEGLTPRYASWKESKVPGLPKLVGVRRTGPGSYARSGRMRAELLDPQAVHVSPQRMIYSPLSNIAGWHEFGSSKMPARPPVEVPPGELHEWDRVFVRWMNGLLTQSGLVG